MIDFEKSLIYQESLKIMNSPNISQFRWECEFIVKGKSFFPFRFLDEDLTRDYNGNVSDDRQIRVMFPYGEWYKDILPNIDDIIVHIKKIPVNTVNGNNSEASTIIDVLRAVYIDTATPHMKDTHPDNMSFDGANLTKLGTFYFQLLDPAFEQIRARTLGVILKNVTMREALRLILSKESKKINVPAASGIRAVDVVMPANTVVYDHIIIPDGTPLLAIPQYLQIKCGGVYSSGMGFYLQKGIWYVYPEYDVTRFSTELKTLTIYNVPANKLPQIETTYRTTANQVIILCTGEMQLLDDRDDLQYNHGNGARFVDARKITEGFGTYKVGKYKVTRTDNASEFVAWDRKSTNNNAMVSGTRITSNSFNEYAKLSRRNVMHLRVVWENANIDLLYPGMPVNFIYTYQDTQREVKGTLSFVQAITTGTGGTLINSAHTTHAVLTVLIEAFNV